MPQPPDIGPILRLVPPNPITLTLGGGAIWDGGYEPQGQNPTALWSGGGDHDGGWWPIEPKARPRGPAWQQADATSVECGSGCKKGFRFDGARGDDMK